jgi:hypothetical protein
MATRKRSRLLVGPLLGLILVLAIAGQTLAVAKAWSARTVVAPVDHGRGHAPLVAEDPWAQR